MLAPHCVSPGHREIRVLTSVPIMDTGWLAPICLNQAQLCHGDDHRSLNRDSYSHYFWIPAMTINRFWGIPCFDIHCAAHIWSLSESKVVWSLESLPHPPIGLLRTRISATSPGTSHSKAQKGLQREPNWRGRPWNGATTMSRVDVRQSLKMLTILPCHHKNPL